MKKLSQRDVAKMSGVGEKTISSFETGQRIGSLKLNQLKRMLKAYGMTEADFFGGSVEKEIAPWELNEEQMATARLLDDLHALPTPLQKNLLSKFQLMIDTLADMHHVKDKRPAYTGSESADWQMLTSRN